MTWLLLGLAGFLGLHSIAIVAPDWRSRLVARLGATRWKGLHSIASLATFAMLVHGYGQARLQSAAVYAPEPWSRHVAFVVMLPVFPLLVAAYLPGRLRSFVGHPMLTATMLWAFAHLLANGTLADVLLFGGFLFWAVADRVSVGRRGPAASPARVGRIRNDAIAVVVGLVLYVAFVGWGHRAIIGVSLVG
ncbi:MAG: NnrU family protein [Steroidobacteraceae bacterium]